MERSIRVKGSSVSITDISWLNRFVVTPTSVLEKKDSGALMTVRNSRAWRTSELNGTMMIRKKYAPPVTARRARAESIP
jgi:hypothetical protein